MGRGWKEWLMAVILMIYIGCSIFGLFQEMTPVSKDQEIWHSPFFSLLSVAFGCHYLCFILPLILNWNYSLLSIALAIMQSFLRNCSFCEAGDFRSDLRVEALLFGSLYAPAYEFQSMIFRTLQIPVGYVWVWVFEKVEMEGKVRHTHVLTRLSR